MNIESDNLSMFTTFFGQDEFPFSFDEAVKSHIGDDENVLVEKLLESDEINIDLDIYPDIEDDDGEVLCEEWMNSKIDLSCVPDSLNKNLSHVSLNDKSLSSVESPAIVSALLGHCSKVSKESSLDLPEKSTSSFYETASPFFTALLNKESVQREIFYSEDIAEDSPTPSSPEQHVPNVEWKLKSQLDAYLNMVHITSKEDHVYVDHADNEVFNDNSVNIENGIETNKSYDPVKHGQKSKVKTPEQKQRKRLQNRTAATRYRSKKRSEQETLNAKISELEEENIKLQQVVENRKQEISFLKNLVVDVLMRKADYIKLTRSTIK